MAYSLNAVVEIQANSLNFDPKRASHLGRVVEVLADNAFEIRTLDLGLYLLYDFDIVAEVTDLNVLALFDAAEAARLTLAERTQPSRPAAVVESTIQEMRTLLEKLLPNNEELRGAVVQLDHVEADVKQLLDEKATRSKLTDSL